MPQTNVEIIRSVIDGLNGGDIEGALSEADPDFELDLSRAVGPVHGVFGLGQVREVWDQYAETWESLRFDPDEFIEGGQHVVVPWTSYARGRGGVEVETRVTFVWTIRDGAIVRASMYQERGEALEAAGLSE